ncbi:glycosyltransferase family 39 protein [Amphritea sp. 2_MG-2023]|jgi:4-amino-4-deoxy-L-arabinose transferase-like glycosyltransferase|uniref:glycosyltransferase family 39 protein n=1 Tax=Amphritea TaxID=515417 RepID=UPI001C0763F9|nr:MULTISPECIES: glycosyltransferase family 39 protein [Amphritea]MBU2964768.1 glycosyltransferase family 39 protein [Amphritea atlantica]MDO6417165.1 glycosyltransferase family 39 protein [Amphritea sp. 2_MG-2023]
MSPASSDSSSLFTAHPFRWFLALLALLFFYREWIVISTPITLFYDEAYYLSWAQTLDWGYYSKPPMVGWLIALTTSLFGNAEWAVKLAAPVLYSGAAIIIYRTAEYLAGSRAALISGAIFLLMPLIGFNSLFITTDAPLIFFWCLCFYAFIQAKDTNNGLWWLLAGIAGGLGLLSKYTFIILPCTFLLYAALSPVGRQLLLNPRFWLTCLLALSFLLPNLYWNYQHDFISFQHTAEISRQSRSSLSFSRLTEFWIGQLLVFGPVFLIYMIVRGLSRQPRSETEKLLWSLFWPTFLVLSVQALMAKANVNWAGPAYIGATLLTGYYLSQVKGYRLLLIGLLVNLLFSMAFYHYTVVTDALGIERKQGTDPYKRLLGWPQFVHQFQPWFDQYPDYKLASDSRKMLAYFGYYISPQDFKGVALSDNDHIEDNYELQYPLSKSTAKQFLFVSEHDIEAKLNRYFSDVTLLTEQVFPLYSNFSRTARLYKVSGFKGIPKNGQQAHE